MDATEKMIRQEVARYRGARGINLIWSLALGLIGGIGLYLVLSGAMLDQTQTSGSTSELYEALGPDGVTLLAAGIFALMLIIGIIWTFRLIRDLGSGARAYEQAMRDEIKRHAASSGISSR
ncbi:MAG: hypothetical protein K8L97_34395 [Anaerolineae bacterium]|nr:hypothetical protein [Anaerolineae bacterium]